MERCDKESIFLVCDFTKKIIHSSYMNDAVMSNSDMPFLSKFPFCAFFLNYELFQVVSDASFLSTEMIIWLTFGILNQPCIP